MDRKQEGKWGRPNLSVVAGDHQVTGETEQSPNYAADRLACHAPCEARAASSLGDSLSTADPLGVARAGPSEPRHHRRGARGEAEVWEAE